MSTKIIILAGGQGKRMNHNLPKALVPLKGRPMINYSLDAIRQAGQDKPLIVVGHSAEIVMQKLGNKFTYAKQHKSLGTGHAVKCAKPFLINKAKNILILYGDKPLISSDSIAKIISLHNEKKSIITMATIQVEDFSGWHKEFKGCGRIVRSSDNSIKEIIEAKDATPQQLEITEVNPSLLCFQANWLWARIEDLASNNAQEEYYLTDLLKLAFSENLAVADFQIHPREGLGINNQDQLSLLEGML